MDGSGEQLPHRRKADIRRIPAVKGRQEDGHPVKAAAAHRAEKYTGLVLYDEEWGTLGWNTLKESKFSSCGTQGRLDWHLLFQYRYS